MTKNLSYKLTILAIVVFYFATHLPGLTNLPVFADEAIYIRWTQLIINDAQQYAFFPLNDGKTPLQMWLNVPFQFLFNDQLFAARIVSVLLGVGHIFGVRMIVKSLKGKKIAQVSAMILATILPYWFFHQRLALIESLLGFWLILATYSAIEMFNHVPVKTKKVSFAKLIMNWPWLIATGLFLGLGLWTKIPAILIFPAFLFIVFVKPTSKTVRLIFLAKLLASFVLAGCIFLLLKIHPAFGQLFSRGSDFLYPTSEVLFNGKWQQTLINIPSYIRYFIAYLTFPVILLNLYGLFSPINKRRHFLMILSSLAFIGPIALLGRVVYPRYLFPAIIFLTVSAALAIEELIMLSQTRKVIWQQASLALLIALIGTNIITPAVNFDLLAVTKPDKTPFVSADKQQYLTEWSSGHGIKPVTEYIQELAKTQTVAVATEGYFGTLPDGVLMYLHRQNVDNLVVEGVGQPINQLPNEFLAKTSQYSRALLLVNSHRLNIELDPSLLLIEYCRPFSAPCLQLWDITSLR